MVICDWVHSDYFDWAQQNIANGTQVVAKVEFPNLYGFALTAVTFLSKQVTPRRILSRRRRAHLERNRVMPRHGP
jgi:hypothetical protein